MISKIATYFDKRKNKKNLSPYLKFSIQVNKQHLADLETEQLISMIKCSNTANSFDVKQFAVLRELSKRTIGIFHHDSQIIAAKAMLDGVFCEMGTGEGKTFVIALVATIRALRGECVYIPTDNTYLAQRDCELLTPFYQSLSLDVSFITETDSLIERKSAYSASIVYSTMKEFGYDYLRDGTAKDVEHLMQQRHDAMLIDEVDSVLVDNASAPMVISSSIPANKELHTFLRELALTVEVTLENDEESTERSLNSDESSNISIVNTSKRSLALGDTAMKCLEAELLSKGMINSNDELYHPDNLYILQAFESHILAEHCYKLGKDYIVSEGNVYILDERTKRIIQSSRWGNGLHQAVEAKESVELQDEMIPTFSISVQNFVKTFAFISGTSGTVSEDSAELSLTYGKGFLKIEPNKPCVRKDKDDVFYLDRKSKVEHVVRIILEKHKNSQPVLVNLESREEFREVVLELNDRKLFFATLTNNNIEEEPAIIALAATPKRITLTNGMIGRGTDIVLGGNIKTILEKYKNDPEKYKTKKSEFEQVFDKVSQEVIDNGGLCVVGCGRSLLEKSDRQLKGRAGRQGDVGESVFISSLEDNLFEMYSGDSVKNFFTSMGVKEGDPLSHGFINKSIRKAQLKYNENLLKSRAHHAKMGSLTEEQRSIIYNLRKELLEKNNEELEQFIEDISGEALTEITPIIHTELLSAFDMNFLAYSQYISDLSKSIFLQSFSNKDPFLEFKPKSFKIFENFIESLTISYKNVIESER